MEVNLFSFCCRCCRKLTAIGETCQVFLSLRVCAYTVLSCFIAYLALGIAMLFNPSQTMYQNGLIANAFLTCIALVHAITTALHLYGTPAKPTKPAKSYQKSLGYTIISSLLAMIAGLILYPTRWHTALTTDSLELRSVPQTKMLLPMVAIISLPWRNSYANITTDDPPKCFIADWSGGFSTGEPLCSVISSDEVVSAHNCSCADMWLPIDRGIDDGYWENVVYRVVEAGPNLAVGTTAATLVLQHWSTYDSSRFGSEIQIPAPMLTILLYDRTVSLRDAFENERGTRIIVDAHCATSIFLTAEFHIGFDHAPYYLYTSVSAGPIPSLNMICDVAQPNHQSNDTCFFTLNIRFSSMSRLEVRRQKMMSPPDVFVEFGAYYSFFQFVAWLLAGMATANA